MAEPEEGKGGRVCVSILENGKREKKVYEREKEIECVRVCMCVCQSNAKEHTVSLMETS